VEETEILQDDRRLNVAITRAKHKLLVIGDRSTLQLYTPFKALIGVLQSEQVYKLEEGTDGFSWDEIDKVNSKIKS